MNSKYITIVLCLLWGILPLQSQTNTKKQPSLEEIGTSAFQGATIGQGMILPASLKSIGNNAFQNATIPCMNFTKCINLEQINPNAFNSTTLTNANVLDFNNSNKLRCYISGTQSGSSFANFSGEVILPREVVMALHKNSLKTIAESAFENSTIGSVDFLGCANLEEISANAFRNMKLTEQVTIDLSVMVKLTAIGNAAFQKSNLTKLILPSSLKNIGNNTFEACTSLASITSHNSTPPTLGTTVFNGVDTEICKLLVPEASITRYAKATQWEDFFRILAIGSEPIEPVDPEEDWEEIDVQIPSDECSDKDANQILFTYDPAGNRIKREIILANTRSAEQPVSFIDIVDNQKVVIYPNPTRGALTVEVSGTVPGKSDIIQIYNMQGHLIKHQSMENIRTSLDISAQPKGVYLMKIIINQKATTWKIIKE
ncbi:leucine-rich repeat protein [Dysgonomonas sp. HGC4]|uniref:leucine-rich repeat protein n=1 Tax=Dysgonomonas sp. HGC4 TaxID=1658009 RepID=UPI000682B62C|nr:leucine-rich repeat protein [Dysgonomonas sp. HGC4]MBD8348454.1 leucine-rich repeat protein [Dysgonomonas sp. HGC4]